jgi:hypothetical protein
MLAAHKEGMMQIICLLGLRNGSPKTKSDLLLSSDKLVCKNAFWRMKNLAVAQIWEELACANNKTKL